MVILFPNNKSLKIPVPQWIKTAVLNAAIGYQYTHLSI